MSLIIDQGPLPFDGESVNPSEFLEAWVNQTRIFGLGPGAFKGGVHQFIFSATDPPPEQDREIGLLWFKRGEGVLYIWDRPDNATAQTFGNVRNWIAIGGRKDIWVKAMEDKIPAFAPVQLASDLSGGSLNKTQNDRYFSRTFFPVALSNGQPSDCVCEVVFIALETSTSGSIFRAVDVGFTQGIMHSGQTGVAGPLMLEDTGWSLPAGRSLYSNFFPAASAFVRRDPTYATNPGVMYIAHAVGSSATNPGTYWLQQIFKRPLPPIGNSLKA